MKEALYIPFEVCRVSQQVFLSVLGIRNPGSKCPQSEPGKYPGGGLPYITDRDGYQNFEKQPLKVTILGVVSANFIP